jgi:hypothetical protein
MTDTTRFYLACELMTRWLFNPNSAQHLEQKTTLLHLMGGFGGQEAEDFVAGISHRPEWREILCPQTVSIIWLEPLFTAPVFAGLAWHLAGLIRADGSSPFRPEIATDDDGIFGYRLAAIRVDTGTDERSMENRLFLSLCAGAAVKMLLTAPVAWLQPALSACERLTGAAGS